MWLCSAQLFSSSWVNIRLHTENQLPRLPGSALKFPLVGGWVGWVPNLIKSSSNSCWGWVGLWQYLFTASSFLSLSFQFILCILSYESGSMPLVTAIFYYIQCNSFSASHHFKNVDYCWDSFVTDLLTDGQTDWPTDIVTNKATTGCSKVNEINWMVISQLQSL